MNTSRSLSAWLRHPAPQLAGTVRRDGPSTLTSWVSGKVMAQDTFVLPDFTRSLALIRVNPWWFEPFFGSTPSDWKENCEIPFLLLVLKPRGHLLLLGLATAHSRTFLRQRGGQLYLETEQDHGTTVELPRLCLACGPDPLALIRLAMARAARELKTFRLRTEKSVPAFVNDFGWCTWDAFYKDVSAAGIRRGLRAFARGGVAPRTLIIDDGWQRTAAFQATSFDPEAGKFPHGLAPFITEIKGKFQLRHVGLWHALQGYWQGVDPHSSLGRTYPTQSRRVRDTLFHGWGPQFDARRRALVHPDHIHRFFQDFHRGLRRSGVDFVKVDNQGGLEYFARGVLPLNATHQAYQDALQASAAHHFSGGLIHCMANCHDILYRLDSGAVWRNSDDFYPRKDAAAQSAHVVHNAFNNLWTHTVALPDWDMFWSRHPHAAYHALARAISGGPIYVSDKPGHHDFTLLRRLVLTDGRALRWPQPALPSPRDLFRDPRRERCLLKISNRNGNLAALAVFHTHADPAAGIIQDQVGLDDIADLAPGRYAVLDPRNNTIAFWTPRSARTVALAPMQAALFLASPIDRGLAVFGLLDKFNSPAAVTSHRWLTPHSHQTTLVQGGRLGFYSAIRPDRLTINGRVRPFTWNHSTGLLTMRASSQAPVQVEIHFPSAQRDKDASSRRAPSR